MPLFFTETSLITLLDEDGDLTYIGQALPNSSITDPVWRIFRLDESGTTSELLKQYANGSTGFDQIWDNRTTLTYS